MSDIIKPQEAAKLLGLNIYTLYDYARKKIVPSIRYGRLVRFDKGDLEKWLQKHKVKEVKK
jgi:excisionase family DNA binding protein